MAEKDELSRRELIAAVGSAAVLGACGGEPPPGYELEPDVGMEPAPDPSSSLGGDDDLAQLIGDPIVLTASATVSPSADATPNLASLTNPYGLPMELLEVRFSAYSVTTSTTGFNNVTGQTIGVKMDLGKIAVVNTGTPMSGFSNYRDSFCPSGSSTQSFIVLSTSGSPTTQVATYSWRLKYPLFIPAGTTLNVKFTNNALVPNDVQVTVTYHCRVMPRGYKPRKLMVPWVSAYNSKAFNVVDAEAATSDESTELDIANPFGVPLELSRFVGAYTGVILGSGNTVNYASEDSNPAQPREYTYVSMRSSQGDELIYTSTPFECLWPESWRAWDLPDGAVLDPGSWLKIELLRPAIDYTPDSTLTGRSYFSVSMLGYREIGGSEFSTATESR